MSSKELWQSEGSKKFILFLENNINNKEITIPLSKGYVNESRSWPILSKWCDITNSYRRIVYVTASSAFVNFKNNTTNKFNFGTSLNILNQKEKSKSIENKLKIILETRSLEIKCNFIYGLIKRCSNKNVYINYVHLLDDLLYWKDGITNVKWASAFWTPFKENF